MKSLVVAGGCFWGVQTYFNLVKGVISTKVGYTGGKKEFPNYQEVCSGETGHTEAVRIEYDPEKTSLNKLLDHFFFIVDPTTLNRQINDVGTQYRSALFYNTLEEKQQIEEYIKKISSKFTDPIVTEIVLVSYFWEAEEYHQNYLNLNPFGYCHLTGEHFSKVNAVDEKTD